MISSSLNMMKISDHLLSSGSTNLGYFFGARNPKVDGNWVWQDGRRVS